MSTIRTHTLPADYQRRLLDEADAATAGDLDAFFRAHRQTFTGMTMVGPPGLPTDPPAPTPPAPTDPPAPTPPAPTDPPAPAPTPPAPAPPAPTNPPARDDVVDDAKTRELGYPANAAGQSVKPVADMTDPEKAAYATEQSRRHEKAWKKFAGNMTPEELQAKLARLDELETGAMTDQQRQIAEAETRGQTIARTESNTRVYDVLVNARLAAVGKKAEELPGLTLIDQSKLLDENGYIDPGKVATALDFAAPMTATQQQNPWPFTGQGPRGSAPASGKDAGQAEAERRWGTKAGTGQ